MVGLQGPSVPQPKRNGYRNGIVNYSCSKGSIDPCCCCFYHVFSVFVPFLFIYIFYFVGFLGCWYNVFILSLPLGSVFFFFFGNPFPHFNENLLLLIKEKKIMHGHSAILSLY